MKCQIWLSKTLSRIFKIVIGLRSLCSYRKLAVFKKKKSDFKVTVNKVCKPDSYLLPQIDNLYAKLSGGTVFSLLDLSMAYQQMPISQESKAYLAINTTNGLFAFNR